jgi:hypothetical protein
MVRGRAAAATAHRWLDALPESNSSSTLQGIVLDGEQPTATGRIDALRTWADGIASPAWSVVSIDAEPVADELGWVVDAVVHVKLAQARTRTRTLRVPIVLQVAQPISPRAAWRIRDVQVDGARRWLRAYRDPVVVRSGIADVVAPAGRRADARRVAAVIANRLPTLRDRYAALAGASSATVWMVDDTAQARAVFGPKHGVGTGDAGHPLVAVTHDGDLIVDLHRWRSVDVEVRSRALVHAVWHVATLDGDDGVPRALVEGIATAEADSSNALDQELLHTIVDPNDQDGRPIAELLVAAPESMLTDAELRRAHAAAAWMLDEHGVARTAAMLSRIDGGLDADHAIRRELGAAPRGVEQRVKDWARTQILPIEDDPDTGASIR